MKKKKISEKVEIKEEPKIEKPEPVVVAAPVVEPPVVHEPSAEEIQEALSCAQQAIDDCAAAIKAVVNRGGVKKIDELRSMVGPCRALLAQIKSL